MGRTALQKMLHSVRPNYAIHKAHYSVLTIGTYEQGDVSCGAGDAPYRVSDMPQRTGDAACCLDPFLVALSCVSFGRCSRASFSDRSVPSSWSKRASARRDSLRCRKQVVGVAEGFARVAKRVVEVVGGFA